MDSWKGLLVSFGLIALFSYLFINGIAILQINNNVNNTILNNSALSSFSNSVNSNLNNLSNSANKYNDAISNETGTEITPTGALTLGTIFHSITTFSGFIVGFANSFFNMLVTLNIINTTTEMVLGAILIIVIIVLFWKFYKSGW